MKAHTQFAIVIGNDLVENYVNSKMLRRNNFAESIISYRSGRKVLEYLSRCAEFADLDAIPDFIFIDYNLRIIGCEGFLELFSKLPEIVTTKIKIVVLSDLNEYSEKQRVRMLPNVFAHINTPLMKNNIDNLKLMIQKFEFNFNCN